MKVLGISAKARHGKDFSAMLASEIAEELGATTLIWSLAHVLKARVYAEAAGSLSFEDVWYKKPEAVRRELQQIGTERGRKVYGEDFWLFHQEAFLEVFGAAGIDLVIIPDIRFPNEVEFSLLGGIPPTKIRNKIIDHLPTLPEEVEMDMINNATEELMEADLLNAARVELFFQQALRTGIGSCVRILSDRPTLPEPFNQHESELALDNYPLENYTAVITNNLVTTEADLINQLTPVVESLLNKE
jgi:hypothetical protein